MSNEAKLEIEGKVFTLPTVVGTEGERAVDVSSLRANTGYITLDDGYGNTGSCLAGVRQGPCSNSLRRSETVEWKNG